MGRLESRIRQLEQTVARQPDRCQDEQGMRTRKLSDAELIARLKAHMPIFNELESRYPHMSDGELVERLRERGSG